MNRRRSVRSEQNTTETGSPPSGGPVYLVVGRLRRPHGIRGEIVMEVLSDFPERIRLGITLWMGDEKLPLKVTGRRPHNTALLMQFEGYDTVEQVGVLRNQLVYRHVDELPALPEGEYYHHQLLGCTVVDMGDRVLGTLREILETGANDVYLVITPEGKELLLPAIDPVIRQVDVEKRVIRVQPPEWDAAAE